MPSSPGSTNTRPDLPWFLDPLRWIGALSDPSDRKTIEMVRVDLADDLRELLDAGIPRRRAYRIVWRRAKLECRFFLPRAGRAWKGSASRLMGRLRRVAKPAMGVAAACVVLLSAKWFFFDRTKLNDLAEITRRIGQMTEEFKSAQGRLGQLGDAGADRNADAQVSQEAEALIFRLGRIQEYFQRTRRDHPDEFYLTGLIGLVDEGLANFWEARGDAKKSEVHWRAALSTYAQGVQEGDPISLYYLGAWYLDQDDLHSGVAHLREAYRKWPQLRIPGGTSTDQVAAEYHWALLGLWKAERNPAFAAEARQVEERVLREVRNGTTKEMTHQILYNAACLRAVMIRAGALDSEEGLQVVDLLEKVLALAGEYTAHMAGAMLSDEDLEGVRALPEFERVRSKAQAIVEASSTRTGR